MNDMDSFEWLLCPVCNSKTRIKLRLDTELYSTGIIYLLTFLYFLTIAERGVALSTSTATAYKYSVAGHLSFSAPKCEKAQKSSGFWANRTYWLCIKDNVLIDPACGTGGMLIEAIHYMQGGRLTYGKIYGQEKNLATSAIARMNLFLHGAIDFKVTQGDTLRSPNYLERGSLKTFNCVVANPPFSLKNWGAEQFNSDIYGRNIWGCPSDSNGDFAWLQHMVKSMSPKDGRCAVVLPQGVLFRGGKEGDIRKHLVESDKLEAVITLVGGVFYSTGVSACILFLNNNKQASHRNHICMIDGSGIYTPQRAQNIMTENDIKTIYDYFIAYEDIIEKVKIVSISDIKEKDYSLAVSNYIEKRKQELVPPYEIRRRYLEAYNEMIKAESRMKELLLEGGYVSE